MTLLPAFRLVATAFAAALAYRCGEPLSAALALTAASGGWLLHWRALSRLARTPGVESGGVLADVPCSAPRAARQAAVVQGMVGVLCLAAAAIPPLAAHLPVPAARAALFGAALVALAHDTPWRLLTALLPVALAARVSRAWGCRVPADDLMRVLSARSLALSEHGVLTLDQPRVTEIVAHGELRAVDVLRVAAALLRPRPARLTESVLEAARSYRLAVPKVAELRALPGEGLLGQIGESLHGLGGPTLAERLGVLLPPQLATILAAPVPCRRVLLVLGDGQLLGWLLVEDAPRPEALALVPALATAHVPPLVLVSEIDAAEVATRLADLAFDDVLALAPSAQPDDPGVAWPVPGVATVVSAAHQPAFGATQAGLAVAVVEAGAALPTWATLGVAADHLPALPDAWVLARQARRSGQRIGLLAQWVRLAAVLAALLAVPLGTLILLDQVLIQVVLQAIGTLAAAGQEPPGARRTAPHA